MRKRPNSLSARVAEGTAAGGPPPVLVGNIRWSQRRQRTSPSRRRRSSAGTPTPSSSVLCSPDARASSQATSQEAYCSSAAASCSLIRDPQFLLEPLHCPQPQHAGGVRRSLESPADFLERVLLLVAQEENLAVVVGQLL